MGDSLTSTRVNSALLPRYAGKNVRLTCRPIKFMGSTATVAAPDGGEVTVTLLPDTHMAPDAYYEVIGSVVNPTTIKMYQCIDMGTNLDMKLVDDTIKLMHDQRFYAKMFSPGD
ncbi:replication factor A protein 3 [Mycena rosella]|uniref:Replication factor A protein 3 n=1 Tax=Mycena rosella TaxID=1033263 RepID=A0AAD7DII7_MYCRO|nr:replication factor A protein 3 [Mycena rosella]